MSLKLSQIKRLTVKPNDTIQDAINILENEKEKIVLVIKSKLILLGTVTDGDIRRALIGGNNLQTKISSAMNNNPIVADYKLSKQTMLKIMKKNKIKQIPIIKSKKVYNLLLIEDILKKEKE